MKAFSRLKCRACFHKLWPVLFVLLVIIFLPEVHFSTDSGATTSLVNSPPTTTCFGFSGELKILDVRGGRYGEVAVRLLLKAVFPDAKLVFYSSPDMGDPFHLIVEGPPQFSSLSECGPTQIPWGQFSGEAARSYNEEKWCEHIQNPAFRLDTSLRHSAKAIRQGTSFIWSPYASVVAKGIFPNLFNRTEHVKEWRKRPYFLAWITSNCNSEQRNSAIKKMLQEADRRNISGFHSLGECMPNTNMSIPARKEGWTAVVDVYKKYRFVLAFENTFEPGYVTEKLVTALEAGAIPVYHGDAAAARLLFPEHDFINVHDIWRLENERLGVIASASEDWVEVLNFLVKLDTGVHPVEDFSGFLQTEKTSMHGAEYPTPFPAQSLSSSTTRNIAEKLKARLNCSVEPQT